MIEIKKYETRYATYTCSYTSGHIIPTLVIYSLHGNSITMTEVGIKCPLLYIAAGIDDTLAFMAFYFYHTYSKVKFLFFLYTYLFTIIIVWQTSTYTASKERMVSDALQKLVV